MTAITDILPYEMIEKVLSFTDEKFLINLFISASNQNKKLAQHIRIVIIAMKTPTIRYMYIIKNRINKINSMEDYLNVISTFHALKIIDSNEKKNKSYKQHFMNTIHNKKQKKRFENLTKCVGKYCENP
jgi:hypothetical protein